MFSDFQKESVIFGIIIIIITTTTTIISVVIYCSNSPITLLLIKPRFFTSKPRDAVLRKPVRVKVFPLGYTPRGVYLLKYSLDWAQHFSAIFYCHFIKNWKMLIIYYGDCNLPVLLITLNKGRKLPKHVLELSVYCEKRTYNMRINTGWIHSKYSCTQLFKFKSQLEYQISWRI